MKYTLLLLLSLLSVAVLAQDKIITHHDEVINGFVVEISESSVFYSTDSINENLKRIAKEDILMILKADGTVINLAGAAPATPVAKVTEQPDRFPIVDLSQYHGYLLQKGNCVYIPTDSEIDFMRAGQIKLKELIEKQGYWQVVDKPEQAHFVLIYFTNLSGQDYAYGVFRTREAYEIQKDVNGNWLYYSDVDTDFFIYASSADETDGGNRAAASSLANNIAKSLNSMYKDGSTFCKNYGKHSKRAKAWILP